MPLSRGFLFTFTAALSWAVSILLTRLVMRGQSVDALNLAFWVQLILGVFWTVILSFSRNEFRSLKKRDVLILLSIGLIYFGLVRIIEPLALQYSPAVNFAFLIRMVVVFTIIFAAIFLGEKITRSKIFLSVMIIIGAYFLVTKGQGMVFSLGDGLTIIEAAMLAMGGNIMGKVVTRNVSPNLSAGITNILGLLPILLFSWWRGVLYMPAYPWLVFSIALCFFLLDYCRFRAYKNASASLVTIIFSFTPVFTAVLSYIFLKETLLPVQLFGGFLIVSSVLVAEKLRL